MGVNKDRTLRADVELTMRARGQHRQRTQSPLKAQMIAEMLKDYKEKEFHGHRIRDTLKTDNAKVTGSETH